MRYFAKLPTAPATPRLARPALRVPSPTRGPRPGRANILSPARTPSAPLKTPRDPGAAASFPSFGCNVVWCDRAGTCSGNRTEISEVLTPDWISLSAVDSAATRLPYNAKMVSDCGMAVLPLVINVAENFARVGSDAWFRFHDQSAVMIRRRSVEASYQGKLVRAGMGRLSAGLRGERNRGGIDPP